MSDTADVVVIGAGIIGASCAYELARRGKSVIVIDAKESSAMGSSGRSFASVRAQWADRLNIALSWNSIQRWRDFETEHNTSIGYDPTGYLLLVPGPAWNAQLDAIELQHAYGVPSEALTLEEAQKKTRFNADGLGGATWCPTDGQIDPHAATNALLGLCKNLGGRTQYHFSVKGVESTATGDWEIAAEDGRSVVARHVINAAGGWGSELAALAGFDIPVVHSRRNIFASAAGFAEHPVPMTVDLATGVYLRSEGDRILLGGMRPGEPDGYSDVLDKDWLEGVLEMASPRFPWLLDMPIDLAASWAGCYENTPDHEIVLGSEPEAPTWVHACGASGHGIIQAPEIGRMVAEQVVDGEITSYDTSELAVDRFRGADSHTDLRMVF